MRQLLLLLILPIQNCPGQDTVFFDTDWKPVTKNKSEYYRIEKPVHGLWLRTDYFRNGDHLQMRGTFQSINPEFKVGRFEYFFPNGTLQHEGLYQENKPVGFHYWYFENGAPEIIENYIDGKLNGDYKEFFRNGRRSVETTYRDGAQSGRTIYYHENGAKNSEGIFKDGDREGLWKFYNIAGELISTHTFKTEYIIPEARLFIKLPNSEWELESKTAGSLSSFIFKRTPILDKTGLEIVPAILVYVESASQYKKDILKFSMAKRLQFKNRKLKIEQTLNHDDKDYPLTYENGMFVKCLYTENGLEHVLDMIHIINKKGMGIQVYLDITKDLAADYELEFWRTIKSLKETQ